MALSIKLDEETVRRLKFLANKRERSVHFLMTKAVREYAEREEYQEQILKEAHEAYEEYRRTGLHLTGEEVDEWLGKLANGEDVDPPACHT